LTIEGRGKTGLTLNATDEMVVRKSGFISDRTLIVNADKAALDIPRHVVSLMRRPNQQIRFELLAWDEKD
jgi:hypothetical protein